MAAISRNLEQLGPNFALYSRTTQDMCVQNIDHWDLFKIEGARFGTEIQEHILDPTTVAATALNLSNTHIWVPHFMLVLIKPSIIPLFYRFDVVSMTESP